MNAFNFTKWLAAVKDYEFNSGRKYHVTKCKVRPGETIKQESTPFPWEANKAPGQLNAHGHSFTQDAPMNTTIELRDKRDQEYLEEIQRNLANIRADSKWADKDREAWMDATMDKKPCIGKDSFGWR